MYKDTGSRMDIIKFINSQYENSLSELPLLMEEINEMRRRWPLSHIPNMTIEEWVTNADPYCFINMIRSKTKLIASGSLGPTIHNLFFQKNDSQKRHIIKLILNENRFKGLTEDEIFHKYMKEIYDFINNFNSKSYVATDYMHGANVIKSKLIMIYKCEGLFPAFSSDEPAKKLAEYLGIKIDKYDDSLGLNIKIANFLIDKDNNISSLNKYVVGRLIWKYYEKNIKGSNLGNRKYLEEDREDENTFLQRIEKAPKVTSELTGKKLAPTPIEVQGTRKYPRNQSIAKQALIKAHYMCECDENHPSFIRASDSKNYTEPHHLIPISAQGKFEYHLDVLPNIVSLCSNCHNHLHYGNDAEGILRYLFETRKSQLNLCGLDITFEELLSYYK